MLQQNKERELLQLNNELAKLEYAIKTATKQK